MIIESFIKEELNSGFIDIKKLNGYDNENYLAISGDNKIVVKTYKYSKQLLSLVNAEIEVLLHISNEESSMFPIPLQFKNDSYIKIISVNGEKIFLRKLSYVEGESIGTVKQTKKLFSSFGNFLAQMDLKFQNINNVVIQSRVSQWDLQYFHMNEVYLNDIPNLKDRDTIKNIFRLFEKNVKPVLPALRKSLIHNDANDWNVLVNNGIVTGIIDFGDLAYSPLINELAVAIAYACFDKDNLLEWASIILKSYNEVIALNKNEIEIIYYLILARLATSISNSSHSRKTNPENKYAWSSEKMALESLYKWLEISPEVALSNFYSVLNLR